MREIIGKLLNTKTKKYTQVLALMLNELVLIFFLPILSDVSAGWTKLDSFS